MIVVQFHAYNENHRNVPFNEVMYILYIKRNSMKSRKIEHLLLLETRSPIAQAGLQFAM